MALDRKSESGISISSRSILMAVEAAAKAGFPGIWIRGKLSFIGNQMGHNDYSMLVQAHARWIVP